MKRIFRYLRGTKDIGMRYPRVGDSNLLVYRDVYHTGYIEKVPQSIASSLDMPFSHGTQRNRAEDLYQLLKLNI